MEERLDRFVAIIEWRELFPKAIVHHLAVAYFDHDPILLDLVPAIYPQRRRCQIQRLEEKLVTHSNCENIIRDSWSQPQPQGSPMFCLFEKIKKCRVDLITWRRRTFGNTRAKLDAKQGELADLLCGGFGQNMERINGVKKEIRELLHHEEVFWRQRSRSIWLPARDKSTKFFHQRASPRQRKNNIDRLYDNGGVWKTGGEKVANIAEGYYKNLFTSSNRLEMERVIESVD